MQNPYIHWIWFQMVSTNIQAKPCKNPSKNHLCIHQPSLFQPTSGTSSRQPPSYRLPSVNWQATNLHGTWCDGFEIKTTLWHKDQKKEVSSTSLSVVVLEGIYWFHGWLVVVYCPAKSPSKSSKILLDQSCPTKNIQQSGQRTGRRRRQNAIALADVVSELALVSSTWQSAKARYKSNTCRNKKYVIYSWTFEAIRCLSFTKAKGENVIAMIYRYPNLPRLMQH